MLNQNKVNFDLSGVPKTLLLPLIGRALLCKNDKSPLRDHRALQVFESLNFDFSDFIKEDAPFTSMSWAIDRAMYFDNEVKTFLKAHPKGVVVNIGAGLETAFYRTDNGEMTWVDLDVPEVIRLREKLLPPPKRVHYIAKSAFDYSWIKEVKKLGEDFFFFAGGVFVYFKAEEVSALLIEMSKNFNAEIVFDTLANEDLDKANALLGKFNFKGAKLQWGIKDNEVESWSPSIKLIYHKKNRPSHASGEDSLDQFDGYMTKLQL